MTDQKSNKVWGGTNKEEKFLAVRCQQKEGCNNSYRCVCACVCEACMSGMILG